MKKPSTTLTALYFTTLMITLPLLRLTSPSFLADMPALLRRRGMLLLARVTARRMAKELGLTLVWFIAVPAFLLAGASAGSAIKGMIGAIIGLVMFALIPVAAPVPSTIIRNAELRGKL